MLAAIRGFNLTIWLIIAATFGGRFVQFMILPFLAILLHQRFGLNELEVGLFLAAASLIGIIFGFYVGYLSDRIGRRKIIVFGVALTVVAMIMLGVADNLYLLFAGTLMQSLARPMVENPGRALMTDTVDDRAVKDMALHMRYFALNVGAALGPLLGAAAGLNGAQSTFSRCRGLLRLSRRGHHCFSDRTTGAGSCRRFAAQSGRRLAGARAGSSAPRDLR